MVTVRSGWVGVAVGVGVLVGVGVGVVSVKRTRTGTHSRKKSRLPPPAATSVTRKRKRPLPNSEGVQVRPHVSVRPPRRKVPSLVPSELVALASVQVDPPSHESSTHMKGLPPLLSVKASSRTSMPSMIALVGKLKR